MHQLVQRVKQRRNGENNVVMGKSPMIIKAYRPPRAPYAIQQQSLIKRVMAVRPVFDSDRKKGKNSYLIPPPKKTRPSAEGHVTTKLAATRTGELEMNTWRPELQGQHQPFVLPSAEDRYVQNYKLQMQQAAKLMDGRFHYAQCDISLQDGYTLNHANPLPPISASQASQEHHNDDVGELENQLSAAPSGIQESTIHLHFTDHNKKSRKVSKKKLQKEKWKVVEGEAYENNLRTKYKFTNDKRQFKDDLERMRELSAIREDLSILGDRTHKLPSTHSSTSLDRIEENNAINTLNSVECSHYNGLYGDKDTLNSVEQLAQISRIDNEVMEALDLENNNKELLQTGDKNETIEESEVISRQNLVYTENVVVPSVGQPGPELEGMITFNETDNTLIHNTTRDIQAQHVDDVKSKFEQTETEIRRINENPIEDGYYKFVSTDDTKLKKKKKR
ncbi:uncharacterized protein LOC117119001 [Anneissia japonica]|uniref:uncharacterized protein LOC117119001 n=1 Tax=Anneissia japonica TaxID=1529436 RepID=UPI0014259D4C|nr:uncharacterized protein LOC117119001 [Anneissia japonica]